MKEIAFRFIAGGLLVSVFALIGDLLKPKSFAGLFGAAPSVALATLILTIGKLGAHYAATETRSMIAGAIAFFFYASVVSWVMMRRRPKALWATLGAVPLWLCASAGLWLVWLR